MVSCLSINMASFTSLAPASVKYKVPSRFPDMQVDFSFAVDPSAVNFDEFTRLCYDVAPELLTDVAVADVYESEGESSLTVRFTFSSSERTLSRAELTPITDAILAALKEKGISLKD